jgi:RNA polymerase sigma-70 factor, ECF subfamily
MKQVVGPRSPRKKEHEEATFVRRHPLIRALMRITPSLAQSVTDGEQKLEPALVYEQYADFVWRSLQRCGLSSVDLEDAFQDVFVVVHRKLGSFKGHSKVTTWLFGICLRVAKKQRRFALFRQYTSEHPLELPDACTPERHLERHQASKEVERILRRMSPEQRAVFTMFELERIDCSEIAETIGVPVGTVYSRLHAARAHFRSERARAMRSQRRGVS